ncbi:MAG TPA: hypothetical protein VNZ85_06970 [Caulobacter sp.]|nr:hypothetical protein [Caulobacter sp.]
MGLPYSDGNPRVPFNVRISQPALDRVKADAAANHLTLGQYVEMLIFDRGVAHTDYYAQQAAIQSYVAAGVSLALAHKLLATEAMTKLQKQAMSTAKMLFGETRGRPPGVGSAPENFDADPRLLAQFDAYKA